MSNTNLKKMIVEVKKRYIDNNEIIEMIEEMEEDITLNLGEDANET